MKKAKWVGWGLALILFLGFGWLLVNTDDAPCEDDADLRPSVIQIAPESNAYTFLTAITNDPVWLANRNAIEKLYAATPFDPVAVAPTVDSLAPLTIPAIQASLACPLYAAPPVNTLTDRVPHLTDLRTLGRWEWLSIRLALHRGDAEGALARQRALVVWSNRILQTPQSLIEWLVGAALRNLSLSTAMHTAWALRGDDARLAALAAANVPPQPAAAAGLRRALQAEYGMWVHTLTQFRNGIVDPWNVSEHEALRFYRLFMKSPLALYWFKLERTRREAAAVYRRLIAEIDLPPAQRRRDEDDEPSRWYDLLRPNAGGRIFLRLMLPALGGAAGRMTELEARHAGAQCVIACLRYEKRHGCLPATLAELVPDWLPVAPCDPFDGAPLRYDPVRRRIYSVGRDLRDDGGAAAQGAAAQKRPTGTGDRDAPDLVFYLDAPP